VPAEHVKAEVNFPLAALYSCHAAICGATPTAFLVGGIAKALKKENPRKTKKPTSISRN
jgi:hypothetical protein